MTYTRNDYYNDCRNDIVKLSDAEINSYYNAVNRIKAALNLSSDIEFTNFDFEQCKNEIDQKAVGICVKKDDTHFIIALDNFFIHECSFSYGSITGETIEGCICHEIAHTKQWNHCKRHRAITAQLLQQIA